MEAIDLLAERGTTHDAITGATVVEIGESGEVLVEVDDEEPQVQCVVLSATTEPLALAPGDEVLVWRASRGAQRAVILGRLGLGSAQGAGPASVQPLATGSSRDSELPDEVIIEAKRNVTLRCGDGSITIRADGKILIKGKDLVSHAQRVNRIKGGSVAIN